MAVKSYTATDLVQRMVDLYTDKVRYHSSHWQVLGGTLHRSDASVSTDTWTNVPDDTIFISHRYDEIMKDFLLMEHSRPALSVSLLAVTFSAFQTAAQTQFTA